MGHRESGYWSVTANEKNDIKVSNLWKMRKKVLLSVQRAVCDLLRPLSSLNSVCFIKYCWLRWTLFLYFYNAIYDCIVYEFSFLIYFISIFFIFFPAFHFEGLKNVVDRFIFWFILSSKCKVFDEDDENWFFFANIGIDKETRYED